MGIENYLHSHCPSHNAIRATMPAGPAADGDVSASPRPVLACIVFMAPLLTSCREGVLDPQGPVGASERVMLFDATAVMLAVIIPVIVATLVCAWWFRAGNHKATYLPDWQYSGRIEIIVWSIPVLIILFLGGIAWVGAHDLDPAKRLDSNSAPLEIQVVSLDWKWVFIYPAQNIALINHLVVPTGRPIHFRLTSATVMNSFFVPKLGSQIYTMPGMATQLNLLADHPGVYSGLSAQFSGDGFSDMRFDVVATTESEFGSWVAAVRTNGGKLNAASYAALARPGKAGTIQTYGQVLPGLFDAIAFGTANRRPTAHSEE
jgi:cytochrome o ubiquinol oxidase subunit 2